LSGHHEKIASWRREQALARTRERRPDLLRKSEVEERPG
jgi:tRNA (guanine37-N1)-methyltransferase